MKIAAASLLSTLALVSGCATEVAGDSDDDEGATPRESIATVSSALQHGDGYVYANWTWPTSGFWNIDQDFYPLRTNTKTFFAQTLRFMGGTGGAYIGLQQDGTTASTRRARFSIWDATAASGANCVNFSGEGVGKTCTVPYTFVDNHMYMTRVWKLSDDAYGSWWGGWIIDKANGAETFIGQIRAPKDRGLLRTTRNFDEYYGEPTACKAVPSSSILVGQPIANAGAFRAKYSGNSIGACSSGSVNQFYEGAFLELGP